MARVLVYALGKLRQPSVWTQRHLCRTWTWLHSPAFRATPLDMKAEADRMFLLGVNQFVGHGYPYSAPAEVSRAGLFTRQRCSTPINPWFPVMPDVTKYLQAGKLAAEARQAGQRHCDSSP